MNPDLLDVVTVTLNPAIDRTVTIENFTTGAVNRAHDIRSCPAGKGVNVASALADFGLSVAVTGFLGRDNAGSFEALFARKRIADHFVRINGQTRVSIKITDPARNETTDLNFPGLAPASSDIAALHDHLARLHASWFILAGSIPEGMPTGIYGELIAILRSRGIHVALDSSGEALAHGLEGGPNLIKPNVHELEEMLGQKLEEERDIAAAARELVARGVQLVIVSMGERGSIYVNAKQALIARPPQIEVKSTVGAGDAMVAGTVAALQNGLPLGECAQLGTAFSLNALTRFESGLSSRQDIEFLARQVAIEPLS